jgi:hypothetical protein
MPRKPKPHPLIVDLFDTLPREGSEWPHGDRERWLRCAAAVFEWVYDDVPSTGEAVLRREES